MKIIINKLILLLYVVVIVASCSRKPLYDECVCLEKAAIPVNIDWTYSNVNVKNVTILLYNTEDGSLFNEFTYEHNNNDIHSYIHLPIGTYTAVVFNELRDQIDYVGCRGYNNLETLEFYSKEDTPIRSRSQQALYLKQPGDLALKVIKDIEVTFETFDSIDILMNVKPIKITSTIDVTAHVKGLNNSRMPALADLRNLSSGYMVGTGKNTTTPSQIQFTINNRAYDSGSIKDGVINASITSFGTLGARGSVDDYSSLIPIELDILFMLVDKDKTVENRVADVTNIIDAKKESNSTINYTLFVDFKDALTNVKPEGSTDSGFNAEVEDWNSVDIPLQQ